MPIQSVLFRRQCYIDHSGFDLALECLEDWDLWIRYSLKNDFLGVEKLTSLFRTPADTKKYNERLKIFNKYLPLVRQKQQNLYIQNISISEFMKAVNLISNKQNLSQIRKNFIKNIILNSVFLYTVYKFLMNMRYFIKKP